MDDHFDFRIERDEDGYFRRYARGEFLSRHLRRESAIARCVTLLKRRAGGGTWGLFIDGQLVDSGSVPSEHS